MGKIRLKRNKQRCMTRRLTGGKKPMTLEQKAERKKASEEQRARNLAFHSKKE